MSEIQIGLTGDECPGCASRSKGTPSPAAKASHDQAYVKPQEVVVVDFQMSFNSMVWFMVKLVLASIPAVIILVVIFALLNIALGGFFAGLFSMFGSK